MQFRNIETVNCGEPVSGEPRTVDILFDEIDKTIKGLESRMPGKVVGCFRIERGLGSDRNNHLVGDGYDFELPIKDGVIKISEANEESCVVPTTSVTIPGPLVEKEGPTVDHFYIPRHLETGFLSQENHDADRAASTYHGGIREMGVIYDARKANANPERMQRLLDALRSVDLSQ